MPCRMWGILSVTRESWQHSVIYSILSHERLVQSDEMWTVGCVRRVPWSSVKYSFIHSVFCLMTGPKPPPKLCLHIVRSRASSFKWEYPLLSLRSSSSFLCLLPRLLATSISPFIFPSTTRFRRQFLHKIWPIQLAFRFLISCRIFLCSLTVTLLHFSHDRSNWSFPSFSSTTFQSFPGISDLLPEASKF